MKIKNKLKNCKIREITMKFTEGWQRCQIEGHLQYGLLPQGDSTHL